MEEPILERKKPSEDLFGRLKGTPTHAVVIIGLALILLPPLIVNFKSAGLAGAQAQFDQMKTQKELDLDQFKRDQAEQRRKSPEVIKYNQATEQRKPVKDDPSLSPAQRESQQKQEQEKDRAIQVLKNAVDEKDKERDKALNEKKEELDRKYDTIAIRREIADAQTAVAGTRSHLLVAWLGHLLLLLGLLALMLQSQGLRQKVIVVVVVVVMFSALSKANRDFFAQGNVESVSYAGSRMPERAADAESASRTKTTISNVWRLPNGVRFQFKDDGKFELKPPRGIDAAGLTGTWRLDADGKTLLITINDQVNKMEIVSLSEKELKLKSDDKEISFTLDSAP